MDFADGLLIGMGIIFLAVFSLIGWAIKMAIDDQKNRNGDD